MKERIKECMFSAGLNSNYVEGFDSIYSNQLEKFAELIVRECAEQSISIGRYNTSSNVTPDLAIAISVGLKKHFGVE